jgi:hypothetical protein
MQNPFFPATYTPSEIPQYQGNPLIEALPLIMSEKAMRDALQVEIAYDDSQRKLPPEVRRHLLEAIADHYTVLPEHIQLGHALSKTIRGGYVCRNPINPTFWAAIPNQRQEMMNNLRQASSQQKVAGFSLIGPSGSGKTTAIHQQLSLYPQVIQHTNYQENPFPALQLTWLKLDCPYDGSIKGLAQKFFAAVDEKLGTDYYRLHGKSRTTVDQMMPAMTSVAAIHLMGCLIVDEIQHLKAARTGGCEKMLNFFVEMSNTMRIPIILVGTPKAMGVLTSEFRSARRASGQGALLWDRMQEDETWDYFLERLWKYQYTSEVTPLTPQLSQAMYHETQGITALTVILYKLMQDAVIGFEETLSKELVSNVATTCFKPLAPFIQMLQSGRRSRYTDLEDIEALDIQQLASLQPEYRTINIQSSHKPEPPQSEPAVKAPIRKSDKNTASGIIGTQHKSQSTNTNTHEELKAQGLIANVDSLLQEA